ncbi:hypothetical protein BC831DRAFT_449783 [Entophlyctis helioformis]|nr:hypothetical protein BC831DRAFT_449783 [Entophlyctis helioformis]
MLLIDVKNDIPSCTLCTISLGAAIIAALASVYGAAKFTLFALKNRFTPTIVSLIVLNGMALLMQLVMMAYVYSDEDNPSAFIARNWLFTWSVCLLNLLQLQVYNVFNGGIFQTSFFHTQNMPYIRAAAVLFMLLTCFPILGEGILYPHDNKHVLSKYAGVGSAFYTSVVSLWGIVQNLFILKRVQEHIARLHSIDSGTVSGTGSGSGTGQKISGGRTIQLLTLAMFAVDLLSLTSFVIAFGVNGPTGTSASRTHYSLHQIGLAIVGFHMVGETVLFEQIAAQFRRGSSGDSRTATQTHSRTLSNQTLSNQTLSNQHELKSFSNNNLAAVVPLGKA